MDRAIKRLKAKKVLVFERGEEEYERSVATSNLLFRFSRPECVMQPTTFSQVQDIIKQAKSQKLEITIKGGGHSYAGHSTAFRGISLDLSKLNTAKLDIKSKSVTIQAGCQWGNVYKTLVNGQHDGFVVNGGRCPTVGVGGFTLGGGLGPFTRSIGMGSDTLTEATLVTADGNLVTVKDSDDPNSNKGRLFWAIRGGGGGNFGVLVEMKLQVRRLRNKDGIVIAGRYQWFPKSGMTDDFMTTMNSFYTTSWPNRMTIDSTWMCDLRGRSSADGVRFLIYYDGTKEEFDVVIDEYIKNLELSKQLKRRSLPEKSTRFLHETLVSQWTEETKKAFPSNNTYSIYSSFIFKNDRITIERATSIIREDMEAFRRRFSGEQVEFLVTWIHSGGKATEKKPSDTAFFWREAVYHTYVTVEWVDKWMETDMRPFLEDVKKKLRPLSLKGEAAFINFPDGALGANAHERAYFGDNRQELRRVKKMWDKDNFFKSAQGVGLPKSAENDGGSGVNRPNEEDLTHTIAGEHWKYFGTKNFKKELNELVELGL
ncbi:uncharacterized protein F4807DRAFT_471786 [Annulohypoxylon truncatum]|uniref:uncharacterized protein n=1 Tax=Annulohypoxylon truncatum TaxID=327061 RepID=UPI002007CC9F|nr:uncharacterized protein F4807DRAFT_471786 [Annulohypoxylon truncatum]KAI1204726.1 hypothetical protein F4807DRAFT_471786 [Annulohypoxylon truncatum]